MDAKEIRETPLSSQREALGENLCGLEFFLREIAAQLAERRNLLYETMQLQREFLEGQKKHY